MPSEAPGPPRAGSLPPDCGLQPPSGASSLNRRELIALLQELSAELDALLEELGIARESSRIRESPRRP
jgi:hypothetical protein